MSKYFKKTRNFPKLALVVYQELTFFFTRFYICFFFFKKNGSSTNTIIDIKTAIDAIAATNSPIRINKVSKQLTTCIVDSYDNITSIYAYKSEWCSRIGQILSNMNITFVRLLELKILPLLIFFSGLKVDQTGKIYAC
ncbi:hypothetical protein BDF21DRAFT_412519 [Thamnidium elegans]|nr:hypothetical protein BDF21DRAFT_412519 [Thamnidium elegans]